MSRVAWLDCASGASGDMLLGAFVDLGLPMDDLRAGLAALPLAGWRIEARPVRRAGLQATKVDVVVEAAPPAHRRLQDIERLLQASGLPADVQETARTLFRRLAAVEAAVHGVSVEEVHFHEVGAVDSIVDVVGGILAFRWLGADVVTASPLNVGGGTVSTEHGILPVPAPATARLVAGAPVFGDGNTELLTPTGALLVTHFARGYGALPSMRLEGVGQGAGARDLPGRPNVVRLLVGEAEPEASGRVVVLETEIDDMSPQLLGPVLDRLLGQGALDAFFTPAHMKKGRPGLLLTVLAPPDRAEALEAVIFEETSTLGLRRHTCERTVLPRESIAVDTPYGPVSVKVARREGRVVNAQPEFEDCRRQAERHGVALKEVWAAALAGYRQAR
jgi:uncharacterized protein (TIGR00299 family) protein